MKNLPSLTRNFSADIYVESFLVAAISAILAIRLFLRVTGFPQAGGGGLHIAHMLWGGLLMLASIFVLLSFIGRRAERLGAILGGIGFGTFIDEVGKFITSDNNYFFKPAVALIYVIFILLFLVLRVIHARTGYTSREYLANALREMEEAAREEMSEDEKKRALKYLESSADASTLPLALALRNSLMSLEANSSQSLSIPMRVKTYVRNFYNYIARQRWFGFALTGFFIVQLGVKLLYAFVLIFFIGLQREQILDYRIFGLVAGEIRHLSFVDWAQIAFSLLSGLFVLCGVALVWRSRLAAYVMFERSILVSIFLTQVFAFYKEQFSALLGLLLNILALLALRFMIEWEKSSQALE
jgi:hypothetical protein